MAKCNKNGQIEPRAAVQTRLPLSFSNKKSPGIGPGLFPYGEGLGEVVSDVAEDVLQLAAEEDHGDDDGNGDNSNDECVLDQALAFVVTEE